MTEVNSDYLSPPDVVIVKRRPVRSNHRIVTAMIRESTAQSFDEMLAAQGITKNSIIKAWIEAFVARHSAARQSEAA